MKLKDMLGEDRALLVQKYKKLFDSEDGFDVMADLERACNRKATKFSANGPEDTARLCGREEVYLHIRQQLELADRLEEDMGDENAVS